MLQSDARDEGPRIRNVANATFAPRELVDNSFDLA